MLGNVEREPAAAVKYGHLVDALRAEFDVEVFDASLQGFPAWLNGLRVFHPDLNRWKQRFYQNAGAFRARSRRAVQWVFEQAERMDAVLQIGVLFDSGSRIPDIPFFIYTDYTSVLARARSAQGRSPFDGEQFKEWFSLEKDVFESADYIFTRGNQVRKSVLDDYGIEPEKVSAVGGGVNFNRLPVLPTADYAQRPTALFIGKDFYRKGGDLVLEAFRIVRREMPQARLWMVTDVPGSYDGDFTGVRIIKPTWDREKIRSLYEKAWCLILPSRLETWGDVLLEAMAYGLPCISVEDEAITDIVIDSETGFLVKPGDFHALARALLNLFSNRDLRQDLGFAARKRVENIFTWTKVVRRMREGMRNG